MKRVEEGRVKRRAFCVETARPRPPTRGRPSRENVPPAPPPGAAAATPAAPPRLASFSSSYQWFCTDFLPWVNPSSSFFIASSIVFQLEVPCAATKRRRASSS